jgi:hypothetical protein
MSRVRTPSVRLSAFVISRSSSPQVHVTRPLPASLFAALASQLSVAAQRLVLVEHEIAILAVSFPLFSMSLHTTAQEGEVGSVNVALHLMRPISTFS